jgi:ubiquinone/menaquinone biosynthesis C-methylase UbiE
MPFRERFDCLWCGRPHAVRDLADIEGWAQLCPDCVGRAGENAFLRFRLKTALAERSRASAPVAAGATSAMASTSDVTTRRPPAPRSPTARETPASDATTASAMTPDPTALTGTADPDLGAEMVAYYAARAPEYDDFYRRHGRYDHGPIDNMAWQVDLDAATRWLDEQPIRGEIIELAAGTGWWSPLLAQKGELWAYDASDEPLSLARDRLLAHGLRAHLHIRDAWAEPDRAVDALFAGFWLSHVPGTRLPEFLGLARRWLRPGGRFVFIDSRRDPHSGADTTRPDIAPGVQLRKLADGRQFRVVKEYPEPEELETALQAAGFDPVKVETTSRFFLLGAAVAR